jgi:hypothetical protein
VSFAISKSQLSGEEGKYGVKGIVPDLEQTRSFSINLEFVFILVAIPLNYSSGEETRHMLFGKKTRNRMMQKALGRVILFPRWTCRLTGSFYYVFTASIRRNVERQDPLGTIVCSLWENTLSKKNITRTLE